MDTKIYIGCSGFNYRTWKGEFYPEDLPGSKWLAYFATIFNTVEINASFYKFPTVRTLNTWYKKTPEGYKLSVKANRLITHYRKFKDVEAEVSAFYKIAKQGLGEKLGPILFQTPPSFKYDHAHLTNILNNLNPDFENVIEFRNSTWWIPEVYETLEKNNITFCSVSYPDLPEDIIETSNLGYVRLHGNKELFKSTYTEEEINALTKQIQNRNFKSVYIYFNNTYYNGAVQNGLYLKNLLGV